MVQKILITSLSFFLCFANSQAQESWSLEKCVTYAIDNSLNMKQTQLSVSQAELTKDANKYARYPNLNASSSFGYQSGLTIDPTTNAFINGFAGSNTWSISSGVTLYNGGAITNSIKQADYDLEASKADLLQTRNDIALNVANAYINIMFSEEQLVNAQKRLELTQAQLEQTEKLIQAGQLPANDRFDLLASIAQNEQAIVVQQNSVDIAYLNLKQLLELDPSTELQIVRPEIQLPEEDLLENTSLETVFFKAINTQPFIQADGLRLKSAELGVDIAKANLYPRLSLFGRLDSRYSTESFPVIGTQTNLIPITVEFMQMEGDILFPQESRVFDDKATPYFNQLDDNFGQSFGLSLSIPIYNNHSTKINVERAKLNIINSEITGQRNKQQLKTNIQTAIANAKAAGKQLEAAQRTRDALKIAYENAQKRLEFGAINTFQLTSAKNNLDTAEVDFIIAKYDYLFKLKVVDYYQGNQIKL